MTGILRKAAFGVVLLLGCSFPAMGQSAPTLGVMVRSNGNQGASFNLILFGTGFTNPLTINSAAGVSFSNIVVTSSTRIDARVTIAADATTGDYAITVTTADGTSNAAIFTVLPPPFITSITPDSVARNEIVTMTIAGGNFAGTPLVSISPAVVSGSITVQSSSLSTIVVKFTVGSSATFGPHDLQVSLGGVLTNTVPLTVTLPPVPTLTGLSVSSAVQAEGATVTLTGTSFISPTLDAGIGITFVNVSVTSSTSITATFVVASTAPVGDHNVTVTNSGGTSNALVFTVLPHPAPTLTSISPANAVQGVFRDYTLTGTNFSTPATINVGPGITLVAPPTVTSPTTIIASLIVASGAPIGPRDITVSSAGGTTSPVTFTVAAPPTLTSISPNFVQRGNSAAVTLTGTNFMSDLTVSVEFGVAVTNVVVNSPTSATATFVTSSSTPLGGRGVQIQDGGWTTSVPFIFTVTGATPVLVDMNPKVAMPGTSGLIQLTGTDFIGLSSVSAGCPYFNFNLLSGTNTSVSGSYSIPGDAAPGTCSIVVNAIQGSSNSLDFTIIPSAPPPTLISISPTSRSGRLYLGGSFRVDLHGTGFTLPITIDAGRGTTVSDVNLVDSTWLYAAVNISGYTPPGRHNVSVTTLAGTSNTIGFVFVPPAKRDTNIDGKSDLLWYNSATGQVAEWLMNGLTVSSGAGLLDGGTGWGLKKIGDADIDFYSEFVWEHTDGSTASWLMKGLTVIGGTGLMAGSTGWRVNQIGDFNGDSKSDLVWQHTDGSVAIWLMMDLNVTSGAGLLPGGTGWSVNQIADFNGDGKSDLLWQHTDGSMAIWLMDGLNVTAGAGILGPGTGWSVKRIGDFDGDGNSDILWQHTDGSTAMWLMNGLSVNGTANLLPGATGWTVSQIGDFDADGRTDILWEHTDGSAAIWLMNGLSVDTGAGIMGAGTGWSVKLIGDFNGDARSDIVWQHTDGSVAIWLMNGLSVDTGTVVLGPGTSWRPVP
jgi:FG-GAP-like repeat